MKLLLKMLIVLLLLGGIAYALYTRLMPAPLAQKAAAMADMPAPVVNVVDATLRDVQFWHEFSGRLTAVNQAEVRPQVSGTIESVHFMDGVVVKKGDLLFTIDQRPYIAALNQAEATRSSAQAQAVLAQSAFARARKLIKEKALSQGEYDQRKQELDVAQANLQGAQAALDMAKLNLEYTEIKAPLSGRVGRAELTKGNLVQAGPNAPVLTTLISNHPIYADFEMDESTYLDLSYPGLEKEPIRVILQLGSEDGISRVGYIESFDNQLNPASGTIRVRAVFHNEDGALVPGLFARLNVGSPDKTKALLIPERAIGTDQHKKFILVVGKDNKVEYRDITLGPLMGNSRVVSEGLKLGDKVIVDGLQRVRPGMNVKPQIVAMETTKPTASP